MQQSHPSHIDQQIENKATGALNLQLVVTDNVSDEVTELSTAKALHVANDVETSTLRHIDSHDREHANNALLKMKVMELEVRCAALERENQQLLASGKRNEEFLAAVAHDLKSSLAGALRIFDVLRKNRDTSSYFELLDSLTDSHQSMLEMLWNILEAYRAKEQAMLLRLAPVDVPALIRTCCRQFSTSIALNKIDLELAFPENAPNIFTDKTILARIVTNLVDNAIKFSPEGSTLTVSMSLEGEVMTISVKDQGMGISVLDQSQIFEKFWQNRKGPYSTVGTGLGLYLCKTLANKLHGEIECVSAVGHGTEFVVRLPVIASF